MKNTISPLKFIYFFVCCQKKVFASQALLCLVWSLKESLFPYFIKQAVDKAYSNPENTFVLLYPLICLIAIWVLMEVAMRIQGILSIHAFPRFRQAIRTHLFSDICSVRYSKFIQDPVGEYAEHINNTPFSCQRVLEILLLHFVSIFGALFVTVIIFLNINIYLSFLLLIWISIHLLIVKIMNPKITSYGDIHAKSISELSGKIYDVLLNFLPMKWYRREKYELERLKKNQISEIDKAYQAQIYFEKMRLYQGLSATIYMFIMVTVMLFLWTNHRISIGDLLLVPMLSFSSLGMIWWLTQEMNILYRELNRIRSSLYFFNKKMMKNNNDIASNTYKNLEAYDYNNYSSNFSLKCVDVFFSYHDKPVLKRFNLVLNNNVHLALVGMSGSGKSTLIKMITGILKPQKGKIYINNYDIFTLMSCELGRLITVVPQEPILFNRTVFDNIHYGRLTATENEVISAAKLALCHDFIHHFKLGYNALVGEGGVQLSIGQKQRIIIARAILSNAKMVILDEPTASLDGLTEITLIKSLKKAFKDRIVLIISHRINTLSLADNILVLKDGNVAETGNRETLYRQKGVFYQMFCHEK